MKRIILIVMLAFACILGYAQSTNPLNYSGHMYVEAIEIIPWTATRRPLNP